MGLGKKSIFFIELERVLDNYEILLLGNQRNQDFYDLFMRSLPENIRIKIKTNISEDEKRLLVGENKFLVRFGKMEYGLTTAVVESISYGTPVIINSELGTADLVQKYKVGFVLQTADPIAVADILTSFREEEYNQMLRNINNLKKAGLGLTT